MKYHIRCEDCRYSKYLGNAPITVETLAAKHALTRRHGVKIYYSGEKTGIKTITPPVIMSADGIPPF